MSVPERPRTDVRRRPAGRPPTPSRPAIRALAAGLAAGGLLAAACARPAAVASRPGEASVAPPAVKRALQEDLHRLFRAQERHRADRGAYSDDLFELRFVPSFGVRARVIEADSTGFSATAERGPYECALFVGDAASPRPYLEAPGVVGCEP